MTYETMLTLVGIVLGSNWLGQFLMEIYKTKRKKKFPTEVILKGLARSHLLDKAEYYKAQGFIDAEEYNDIFEEYEAYRELDGNGQVKREYGENGELRKLPVQ